MIDVSGRNDLVSLSALQAYLAAHGVVVTAIGITNKMLHTYDGAGFPIDLPVGTDALVAAYVPVPPLTNFTASLPIGGKVRTTDATPTEVYRLTLTSTTGYAFDAMLIGVDGGNGAIRVIRASVAVKRLNAAALMVGAPVVYANQADAAASTWGGVSAIVSGNDLVVQVTGLAGRTIDWSLSGSVVRFAPGGLT